MKKIFTLISLFAAAATASAADYTDRLEVTVNGVKSIQQSTISVDKQSDGKYTLKLNNFILNAGAQVMPVGNIVLTDVEGTEKDGLTAMKTEQEIFITEGDLPGIPMWIGPGLKNVPVNMTAEIRGEKLYTVINIDMEKTLHQVIKVVFGNGGYQIGNSDFESFHTATVSSPADPNFPDEEPNTASSDEPDFWHSFMSASGNPALIYLAGYTPHTFISDVVRPGTQGAKSVLLTSSDMGFFGVANGTITTGRINTGSMIAADLANHSWSSVDSIGTDATGAPFYSAMNGMPDSLSVWVKFKQLTPKEDAPYATIKAVITDGSYYQDPEDKEYDNIVAKATNNTIESNGFEWQRLSIPFIYEADKNNGAVIPDPKVIHVTISTNAEPGKGSTDSLYVDDLQLIYNCELTGIAVKDGFVNEIKDVMDFDATGMGEIKDEYIKAQVAGRGTKVEKETVLTESGMTVKFTLTSGDLQTKKVYTLNIKGTTTGISSVNGKAGAAKTAYDLKGRKVSKMENGKVYIVKDAAGKTRKTFGK